MTEAADAYAAYREPPRAPGRTLAFPVDVPREVAARGPRRLAVRRVGVGGLGHFARGRSAALSTRPVGSRMPIFVDIVSGLAVKRSPALIATQRYPWSGVSRFIAGPISAFVAA